MLVLSRKKGERIVIGDDIVITVVEIRSNKVRLGIEAPKEISAHRQEIQDRILQQREEEERRKRVEEEHDTPDDPPTGPDSRSFLTMSMSTQS